MIMDSLMHQSRSQGPDVMHGVYSGTVTDNKDPENFGRVKVKIPIIDQNKEFDWMRIVTFMGGKQRGALFIPEVGDEVLVAFVMGDIKAPIVIGSLWNKNDKPPEGMNEKNDIRKIKTRSGHEIIFDDNDSNSSITVQSKGGHKLELLDKDKKIQLSAAGEKQQIVVDASQGSVTVKSANTKITLSQSGDIQLEGTKAVTIKGGQINIQATSAMEMKANASMTISTQGVLQLKGSLIKLN